MAAPPKVEAELPDLPEQKPSESGHGLPRDPLADYVPRTELGRELITIRKRIVASGQRLLTREEVEREVAERRGGYYGREE